jgi:CHAD domain-containing protein
MLQEKIILYLNTHARVFVENFRLAAKTADIEALHDMRVSLKRLHTLIRLLNFEKQTNFRLKKVYKPFRKLFKIAGPLRDLQVEELLLEEFRQQFDVNQILFQKLNKRKAIHLQKFLLKSKSFKILKANRIFLLLGRHIQKISGQQLAIQLQRFKESRFVLLAEYSNQQCDRYNLHSARKMLKDLAYLSEMAESDTLAVNQEFLKYKETGQILGLWHDRDVMLRFLAAHITEQEHLLDTNSANLVSSIAIQKDTLKNQYHEKYSSW